MERRKQGNGLETFLEHWGLLISALCAIVAAQVFFFLVDSSGRHWIYLLLCLVVLAATFFVRKKVSRRTKWVVIAIMLWLPIVGLFGDELCYQPLKFGYLIHRVESAHTSAAERAAFELAKRWGCCWEIHLESPANNWLDSRQLDNVMRDPGKELAVELEWLETKPNGVPYRAHRTLIQKTNIYVLMDR